MSDTPTSGGNFFTSFSDSLSSGLDTLSGWADDLSGTFDPYLKGAKDFLDKMSNVADLGYAVTGNERFKDFHHRVNQDGVNIYESASSIKRDADRFSDRAKAIKEGSYKEETPKSQPQPTKKKKKAPNRTKTKAISGYSRR